MSKKHPLFVLVPLILLVSIAQAQVLIPGLSGIALTVSENDYSIEVSTPFTFRGLEVTPDGLTLRYQQAENRFSLFGAASISLGSSVAISFGTEAQPAFIVQDNALYQFGFDLSSSLSIASFSLSPNPIAFRYKPDAEELIGFGEAVFRMGADSLQLSFGDVDSPSLRLMNGQLSSFSAEVISPEFSIKGLSMTPTAMGFAWEKEVDSIRLFGGLMVRIPGEAASVTASLGTAEQAGLILENGNVRSMQMSLSGNLSVRGFNAEITMAQLDYLADEQFELRGQLSAILADESITLTMGDEASTGIVLTNGELESVDFSLSSAFNLAGLGLEPDQVRLRWRKEDQAYWLSGTMKAVLGTDELMFQLGKSSPSGLKVVNNALESIDFALSGDFTLRGIRFVPKDVEVRYEQTTLELFGAAMAHVAGDSLSITLGDASAPGVQLIEGNLSQLAASVDGVFHIDAHPFMADELSFRFTAQGNDVELSGKASTTLGDSQLELAFYDQEGLPGLVYRNGALHHFSVSVTGEFAVKSFRVKAESLFFGRITNGFQLRGNATAYIGADSLALQFGEAGTVGIQFVNNQLTKLQAISSGAFHVAGLTLAIDTFELDYVAAQDHFGSKGLLGVELAGQSLSVAMGHRSGTTFTSYGLIIQQGEIEHLELFVIGDFLLKNIAFKNKGTSITYNKAAHEFDFSGNVAIHAGNDDIAVSFGTVERPGVRIINGELQEFDLAITSNFSIGGISFKPHGLEFEYTAQPERFAIFGDADATIAGETIKLHLGTASQPGLVIENRDVQHINAGMTANFGLKGITVRPRGLTFEYNKSPLKYLIHGTGTIAFQQDSLQASFGTAASPGITFVNNQLEHLQVALSTSFHLRGAKMTSKNMGFSYDKQLQRYTAFGEGHFYLASDSVSVALGTAFNPGLIVTNGALQKVDMTINAAFKHQGLSLTVNSGHIQWDAVAAKQALAKMPPDYPYWQDAVLLAQTSIFRMSGTYSLTISGQHLAIQMGQNNIPGIVVTNGSITQIDIGISSDITAGPLELIAKDLRLREANSTWSLAGEVQLKSLFEVDLKLGEHGQPGVDIRFTHGTPEFHVNDVLFEIQHVHLGPFNLNDLNVHIKDGALQDIEVDVLFPGGMEIGGEIRFNAQHRIEKVAVQYTATTPEAAIPLPGGGHITHIDGQLDHLDDPFNIVFSGGLDIVYGGPMSIAGTSVNLLYVSTHATIGRTGFKLNSDILVGAYQHNGKWESLLVQAHGELEMVFGKYFAMDAQIAFPSQQNHVVKIMSKLYIDKTHVVGFVDVDFFAPEELPFIGGTEIGRVEGAFSYMKQDASRSYVAAWVEFDPKGVDIVLGAKYNMGTKSITTLGSKEVTNMKAEVHSNQTSHGAKRFDIMSSEFQFNVENPIPQGVIVDMKFPGYKIVAGAEVTGPERDNYDVSIITTKAINQFSVKAFGNYYLTKPSVIIELEDSAKYFIIDKGGQQLSVQNGKLVNTSWKGSLVPGKYTLKFMGLLSGAPDPKLVSYKVHQFYIQPQILMTSNSLSQDRLSTSFTYVTGDFADTYLTILAEEVGNPDNIRVIADQLRGTISKREDQIVLANLNYAFDVHILPGERQYRVYAKVKDPFNKPYISGKTTAFTVNSAIRGQITHTSAFPANTDMSGIPVYLDVNNNGVFDMSTGGTQQEPVTYTDKDGKFHFDGLSKNAAYHVGIILPPGIKLAADSPTKLTGGKWPAHTYSGTPVVVNFKMDK